MFKKLLLSTIICILGLSGIGLSGVKAEGEYNSASLPYEKMQIQVMPEYDYPADWSKDEPVLLVGYFGTLTNKSGSDYSGPIEIKLPVKEKDFQIYLAAEFPADGSQEVPVEYKIDKDKGIVTWTPTKPIKKDAKYEFVIETYSNPYVVKDNKKFTYNYEADADIKELLMVVYSPINSKDFKINPAASSETTSEYGEKINQYSFKDIKKGAAYKFDASYVKKDNVSSMSEIKKQTPQESATDTALGDTTKKSAIKSDQPILDTSGALIIALGFVIMGILIFLGLRGRNSNTSKTPPKKSTKAKTVSKKSNVNEQKKLLRKMLLNGEIDQKKYDEEIKKIG